MSLGSFIQFVIKHNETIVLVLVSLVCLLSAVVVFFWVFGPKTKSTDSGIDISSIEESLKKILSQTQGAITNVNAAASANPSGQDVAAGATAGSAGGAAGNLSGASTAELTALKSELEKKAKHVEELQRQVELAKATDSSTELLTKIKNLEGKLSEYEIIEDDIADLSHYKDENAKLKTELESFKRGGAALVDQFAAAMGSETPTETTQTPGSAANAASSSSEPVKPQDILPAKPEVTSDPLAEAVAKAQTSPNLMPPTLSAENVGDVVDFANSSVTPAAAPAPVTTAADAPAAAPAAVAEAPVAAVSAPVTTAKEGADIFSEMSGEASGEQDPMASLGDIDTNRMLEELKDLNSEMNIGAEALEEAPDIDKLASEAVDLKKT